MKLPPALTALSQTGIGMKRSEQAGVITVVPCEWTNKGVAGLRCNRTHAKLGATIMQMTVIDRCMREGSSRTRWNVQYEGVSKNEWAFPHRGGCPKMVYMFPDHDGSLSCMSGTPRRMSAGAWNLNGQI